MDAKDSGEIAEILAKYGLIPQNPVQLINQGQRDAAEEKSDGKKQGLRDFSRTITCPICNVKCSTKSGYLTHLTRLALSGQLDMMTRYKHAATRVLIGKDFMKFDVIESFMRANKKTFLKQYKGSISSFTSPSSISTTESSVTADCSLPEPLISSDIEGDGSERSITGEPASLQDQDIEEGKYEHDDSSQEKTLTESTEQTDNNLNNDIYKQVTTESPQEIVDTQKLQESQLTVNDTLTEEDSISNSIHEEQHQEEIITPTKHEGDSKNQDDQEANTADITNDNDKVSKVESSGSDTPTFECVCGKTFDEIAELTKHAAFSAKTEAKNRNYSKALEHINLRLKYPFPNEFLKSKFLLFKEKTIEKLDQEKQYGEESQQKTTVVYVDGSGDSDESGTFRCGFGVNVVDGEKYSFSLPGSVQTVLRAELMAILVALLVTNNKDILKIKSDSEISCNWFNQRRKEFTDMMDNRGYDNGDIFGLIVTASQHRNISVEKVKAHTEGDDADSLGNQEADRLANEGRTKQPQDNISIKDWISKNGWNIPETKTALQNKIWEEESLPVIDSKSKTCEICGKELKSNVKKRQHVKSKHQDFLRQRHKTYSCRVVKQEGEKITEVPNSQKVFRTQNRGEIIEEEPTIIIRDKVKIPRKKFDKESDAYKLANTLLQSKENEGWSEHCNNLLKLKELMYKNIKEINEIQQKKLSEKYTRMVERRQESTKSTNGIINQSRDINSYKEKLDVLNTSIKTLRDKMENTDNPEISDAIRKQLRKQLAKRNKFTKRVELFEKQYKIKKIYKNNPKLAIRLINGETNIKCPFTKAQMEEYFSNVFQSRNMEENVRPSWWNEEGLFKEISKLSKGMLSKLVTPDEVESIIKHLPYDSTPGIDGLNYKAWTLLPKYSDLLSYIFNKWLTYGAIPKEGCVAKLVLLYKKGNENELSNWRPISLQQSLTKIFMKIIQNRIINVLEHEKIMSNMQKGFLRNNGCLEHVQSLSMILGNARRGKHSICGVFYDIKNAFGCVPQDLIFEILKLHKFPKIIINVIRSYYERDKTIITNGKIRTDVLKQHTGVKQGCPLSPLLFILALDPALRMIEKRCEGYTIDPILEGDEKIKYLGSAFADDLVLVSSNKKDLNNMHKILMEFLNFTKMEIGIGKSSAFGSTEKKRKWVNIPPRVMVGDKEIPRMELGDIYNYLGVSVTPNTGKCVKRKKCNERIEKIMDMLQKTANAGLTPWQLQHCIKTYYLPTLIYSIGQLEQLGKELRKVDFTIRKLIRKSLRLPNTTPSDFIHCHNSVGGLGMPELTVEKDIFTISTWFQLLTSGDSIVRNLAWRELEDYAHENNVTQKKDAEYNVHSGNCQHFLNWCTREDGLVLKKESARGNRRVSSLLKALARLGCCIKKDKEENLLLLVGTVPVKNNLTQTLRGISRTRRAAKWMNGVTGQHVDLARKAREGNWWIAKPDYISIEDYIFACKTRVNCLPCPVNLMKWKKADKKSCPLCGCPCCTQSHILSGCPKLLQYYTKRHDYMVNTMHKILTESCNFSVLKEKEIPNSCLRPDLTIPEGKAKGVFLDVGITASENPDKGISLAFNLKHKKYANKHGIRIDGDKEVTSNDTFRFVPLIFTTTGLYKPSLFRDLANVLKLKPKTVNYILRRLSALAIKGTRHVWIAYKNAEARAMING